MSAPHDSGQPDRFDVRTTAESHFSWVRTRLRPRTHADGLHAHGRLADRLRLRDRPVLRTLSTDPRGLSRPLPRRCVVPGACADLLRRHGDGCFSLGVPVDASLPVGWKFCDNRRHGKEGKANTALRGRNRPHLCWHIRFFCRTAASRVAAAWRKHRMQSRFETAKPINNQSKGE